MASPSLPGYWRYVVAGLWILLCLLQIDSLPDITLLPRWGFACGVVFVLAAAGFQQLRARPIPLLPGLLMLVFLLVQALSITQAVNAGEGVAVWARYATMGGYALVFWAACRPNVQEAPFLWKSLLLVATLATLPALFKMLALLQKGTFTQDIYALKGLFSHKNLLASFLMLLFPLSWGGRLYLKGSWRPAALVLSLLMLAMLFLLRTRGVWLATFLGGAAALLTYLLARKEREKLPWPRIALGSGLALVLMVGLLGLPQIRKGFFDSSNIQKRFAFWENSWEMISDKPALGVGAGNWKLQFPRHGLEKVDHSTMQGITHIQRPHNDFLWVWSEAGPLALLAYLGLFLWGLRRAWLNYRHQTDARQGQLQLLLIWSLAAYGVFSLGDFPLERAPHGILFLTLLGLIYAGTPAPHKEKEIKGSWLPAVALVLSAASLYIMAFRYEGQKATPAIQQANAQQNASAIIPAVNKAENRYYTVDLYANPLRYYSSLGYFAMGQSQKAYQELLAARRAAPYNILVHYNLANYHAGQNQEQKALLQLDSALQMAPKFERARRLEAKIHLGKQRFVQALETLNLHNPYSQNREYLQLMANALRGSLAGHPQHGRFERLMKYLQKRRSKLQQPMDYIRAYRSYRRQTAGT